jgi:hypothetical protein
MDSSELIPIAGELLADFGRLCRERSRAGGEPEHSGGGAEGATERPGGTGPWLQERNDEGENAGAE